MEELLRVPLTVLLKGPINPIAPLPSSYQSSNYFGSFKTCIVEEMRAAVVAGLHSSSNSSLSVRWSRGTMGELSDRASLRVGAKTATKLRNGDAVMLQPPQNDPDDQLSRALGNMALSDRPHRSTGPAKANLSAGVLGVVTGFRGEYLELALGRGVSRLNWLQDVTSVQPVCTLLPLLRLHRAASNGPPCALNVLQPLATGIITPQEPRKLPEEVEHLVSALMPQQAAAVREALSSLGSVHLVQGPPGTGKSRTICALLLALRISQPDRRVLVTAPSNAAVQLLLARYLEAAAAAQVDHGAVLLAGASTALHAAQLEAVTAHCWTDMLTRTSQAVSIAADRLDELQLTDANIEMLLVEELPRCRRKVGSNTASASCTDSAQAKQQRADQVKQALQAPYADGAITKDEFKALARQCTHISASPELAASVAAAVAHRTASCRRKATAAALEAVELLKACIRQVPRMAFDGALVGARDALEAARRTLSSSKTLEVATSVRASAQAVAAVAMRVDRFEAEAEQLDHAHAVFGTLGVLGRASLEGMAGASLLIVDEAAQAFEAALLPALRRMTTESSIVLVGDPQQLPAMNVGSQAMVESTQARSAKFGKSAMERLMTDCAAPFTMLDWQFRMGPSIAAFPSECFYDSKLLDHASVVARQAPWTKLDGAPWIAQLLSSSDPTRSGDAFACCVHVDGVESSSGPSLANLCEAKVAARTASHMVEAGLTQVALVSFYAAQLQLLRQELRAVGLDQDQRVTVMTVDACQGSEMDGVIISCVRANKRSSVGFLQDYRRLNVALTRAKFALVVLCNVPTLQAKAGHLSDMIQHFARRRVLLTEQQLGNESASSCIRIVEVPRSRVGTIVGHKGHTVQAIEQQCGVQVWVPPRGRSQHNAVQVLVQAADHSRLQAADDMIKAVLQGKGVVAPCFKPKPVAAKIEPAAEIEPVDDITELLSSIKLHADSTCSNQTSEVNADKTHGANAEQAANELAALDHPRESNQSSDTSTDSDDDLSLATLHARGYYSGMVLGDSDDDADSSSDDEAQILTPARRARDSRLNLCAESDASESDDDEAIAHDRIHVAVDPYSMSLEELQQALREHGMPASRIGRSRLVLQGLLRNLIKKQQQAQVAETEPAEPGSVDCSESDSDSDSGEQILEASGRLLTIDSNVAHAGSGEATLDLNRARYEDLVRVPSIGPKRAEAIIAWRNAHGEFLKLQDVQNVSGIGRAAFNILRVHVHVGR